jgi:DNA-binding CsgD family transcriptional regulator
MTNTDPRPRDGNEIGERRWRHTYDALSADDHTTPLGPVELERLAMAAYFIGKDVEALDVLARTHQAFLTGGDAPRATRTAFWLAFILLGRGENARAAGWLARARRLLEGRDECVERGYLLLPVGLQHIRGRELAAAAAAFAEAAEIGERFGEPDLVNLARQGHGRTLIALGDTAKGVALLDEVMIAVTSGELSPIVSGTIYCSVISACFDMFDIRRAQEWTEALNHWCASQPDLVPYRGECLIQRAEIMRLHGVWPDALEEARRACECLAQTSAHPALGGAFYQVAELHRLRGEFAEAEDAYAAASHEGRTPHLRLAQGRSDAAKAAISRAVEEARDRRTRSRLLAASIEILLAAGDVAPARAAADELSTIAAAVETPFLRAISAHGSGAVLLAEGKARNALTSLRDAWTLWRDLGTPYEAARTTALIALACRELGDADSAHMEFAAAARAFRQLGAAADLARVEALSSSESGGTAGQLTAREVQVLKLVASGRTNRAIADELHISEKTVARHVSNIFTKLDLSSRAAATAYAFKHHLT